MVIGLFRAQRNFLLIMYDAASHGRLKPRVTSKAIFNLSSYKPCFYYPKKKKRKKNKKTFRWSIPVIFWNEFEHQATFTFPQPVLIIKYAGEYTMSEPCT